MLARRYENYNEVTGLELNLAGKVAIVTGGGAGLGAAISELLAAEGAHVVVNYIVNESDVTEFVDDLNQEYDSTSIAVYGDISSAGDIDNIIDTTIDKFGKIDILINNAGIWPQAYVKDMDEGEWKKVLDVNLTGPFIFSKKLVNYWLDGNRKGKIVNITSQAAFRGSTTGHAHYAASKAGMVGFTMSLAREVAPYGITVTGVAPGMVRTGMNKDALNEREQEYLKRIPLGRIADPKEVAYPVIFLSSEKSDYITGCTLDVTGGMLMR